MSRPSKRNLVSPRDLLERALASPKGIRIWFNSSQEAIAMRNRMATVKTEERKKSTKIYELSSPLYNSSTYDTLATVIKPGVLSIGDEIKKLADLSPDEILNGVWLYIIPEGLSDTAFYVEEI